MNFDTNQDLNSLLVNIRSVVLSCKGGVLLNDLQEDYKKLIGTYIPFEKFGFDCLETLLQNASNFISIRKNTNGQLFAEAVSDSSTAHLSNLISKQKNGKLKKHSKSLALKSKSCYNFNIRNNDIAPVWTNYSATDKKNEEIDELKTKLEKEKSMNEELTFEVNRLQAELKVANKALLNSITRQKYQEVPTNDEKSHKNQENCILLKEIDDLKSKLEKEKKLTQEFFSKFICLNSSLKTTQDTLFAEQEKVKTLKIQVGALKASSVKESSPLREYLSSATNSKEKCQSQQNIVSGVSWDDHLNLLETDAAKQLNTCNGLSSTDSMLAVLSSYEEQMSEQIEKFVSQIKKQNQKLMMLESNQQKNYRRLDEKIKNLRDSVNIENIIQEILEHPQFVKSRKFFALDNAYQPIQSITPLSGLSDNESEQSFKISPTSPIGRGKYGPPRAEAYGKKRGYCSISYKMHRDF